MKDQWDYVLEELGDKQLFQKHQYSTDISFLLLLLSNDHPTINLFLEFDSAEIS